jgi:hypothetical protein
MEVSMPYAKDVFAISPEEVFLLGAGVLLVGTAAMIGSQIAAGCFTGFMSACGIAYTLFKMRKDAPRIWNLIIDRPLTTDIVIDAGVFLIVGSSTVTGLVAGASASLFTSISLCGLRRLGRVEVPPFDWSSVLRKKPTTQEVVIVEKDIQVQS